MVDLNAQDPEINFRMPRGETLDISGCDFDNPLPSSYGC